MSEVTPICKRSVVSTRPVQLGKVYPLSVLDRPMENHHIRMVYYYRPPKDTVKLGDVSHKLRDAIMETLLCYPVVTGRLKRNDRGKWIVKCNDAGVRIVEARAQGSVESWLENVDREKELQLVHWEDMLDNPYFWSTFYVQMTEFEEGGVAVGVSCSHLLADPVSASLFIKSWADVSLTGKMLDPPFFYPLPQRRPLASRPHVSSSNRHLIERYCSVKQNPTSSVHQAQELRTLTLAFTGEMVKGCVDLSQVDDSSSATPSRLSPSPFQAVAGVLWAAISRIRGAGRGLVGMSICVDTRKVLGLDKGFFGNCMVYSKVVGDGLDASDISGASRAIGEAMEKADYDGVVDLIEWLERNDDQCPPWTMDGDDLVFVNLENIDPYSAAFGGCVEPLSVSYYIQPVSRRGKVLVLPAPRGDGPLSRVVMVTLPREEVGMLCQDALMKQFVSS